MDDFDHPRTVRCYKGNPHEITVVTGFLPFCIHCGMLLAEIRHENGTTNDPPPTTDNQA